ncbi:MAG: HIT family protein [Treponema sp.]|nr:HIT family protein [Treponema sp.]
MEQKADCIFCKIIRGELPSKKIYEDERTFAFLDIAKDIDGHILVIPKDHCTNLLDAPKETLECVMGTVQKVARNLTERCGYDGVNTFNCNGESSGQTVFHYHVHVIPRKTGDGERPFKFSGARHELEEMHDRLSMQ